MNSFKPIYWHQGLFLKPHHFQYLQAYQQQDDLVVRENLEPYFWGVSKLVIDKKELLNKIFFLQDMELIFMDGTIVRLSQNAIAVARSFNDIDEDIKVYIGLKSFSENSINVTELDSYEDVKNVDTRFITKKDAMEVKNLYHNDDPADIQFMDYYLKIFFENEIEGLIVKLIQKDLNSHVLQLEEYKLPSDSLIKEPHYLKYIMALQALASYVPKLNHLIIFNKSKYFRKVR